MTTKNPYVDEEQPAGRLSREERFVATHTPSLALRRFWSQIFGTCVLLVILIGASEHLLEGWSVVETAWYWGQRLPAGQSLALLFGVAAVLLAGYVLLEYYVPERFFEGEYMSMVWPLTLTSIVLSAIVWTPAYLRAVVGVATPTLVQSPVATLLVFTQAFVAPILTRLVWSDKTRLLDLSLLARASDGDDQSSASLLRVARDESIPLAGESFHPLLWLYLGWVSVVWFGLAVVFEDMVLAAFPAPVVLTIIGMPTIVAVVYLGWRTMNFIWAMTA